MAKAKRSPTKSPVEDQYGRNFKIEWKTTNQKLAWLAFQKHDIVFLTGPAGSGKTHLAMAYALSEFLEQKKKKIVLTRPIIESGGEKLGFLPGNKEEKTHPFMMPFYDVIDKMSGGDPVTKERIYNHILIEPTAYMKGRTYENAVCIFDEAQDATNAQLKLFMTRFGKGSKIIICGDVTQSDIEEYKIALPRVLSNLQNLPGVGSVEFNRKDNQRHPLVEMILDNW